MGIRFYCPNGHKLNVKTFLAGKRGICPRCGSKFEIPLESVRAPGDRRNATAAADDPVESVGAPGEAPPVATLAAAPAPIAASVPANASAAVGASAIAGGAAPLSNAGAISDAGALPLVKQPAALPTVRPFAPLTPAPAHGFSPAGFPAAAAGHVAGGTIATMRPAMPSPAASGMDPIAEAPAAVWYVRPASGGQFGPAAGEIMRQWLTQRRVGADSMLWREGWTDWKKAVAVFPSLGPSPAESAAAAQTTATPSNFAADDDWVEAIIDTKPSVGHHAPAHLPHGKRKQSNTIVIISFFLILLCILLAVVMVTVVMQQGKDDASWNNEPAGRAQIRVADCAARPLARWMANT